MPFLKKINIKDGVIGIWHLSEDPDDFSGIILSDEELENLKNFKVSKRKTEFLAVRALIQELTGQNIGISYTDDGSPYLKNNHYNISISHSKNLVAIIINSSPVGIDVEEVNREIHKIANKFLSENELKTIEYSKNKQESLILYWSAKESIFKYSKQQGIIFKEDILIEPFKIKEKGTINAKLKQGNNIIIIKLHYIFILNNALVWCANS